MQVVEAKGFRIPIVGLGTWALRGRDCARLVEQAIRIGYRHIDTAQMYDNERRVGEGMRASGKRDEVMVTTKVQPTLLAPRDLERSVKESLAQLRLDVIDLLLIHWPNPRVPLSETLGAMAKVKRAGYAKQIGVSNFTVALLDEANKVTSEPLVCNQIECHPFLDQDKVIAACRKHGMAMVAYSPIARGQAKGDALLARIGQAHKKTAAQVCLRWLTQQGIVVIPRTSKIERLEENFSILDFDLSDAEMREIAGLASRGGRIVDWTWSPKWDCPFRRPGPIDDAAATAGKPGNLPHLRIRQVEIQNRKILLQPLDLAGARDHHDALLGKPAQAGLRRGLAMGLADFFQQLVALGVTARDRAVGHHRHAVLAAGGDHLVLVEIGMALDLVADQRFAGDLVGLVEQGHSEIRNADLTRVARAFHLGHGAERFGKRHARVRPVDQQEVDDVEPQPRQAFLHRALKIARRQQRRLDLRRDHHLGA